VDGLDIGMLDRDAAHVQFEDDGLLPRDLRAAILTPGKSGFDDPALWDVARVVAPVKREILARAAEAVAEDGVAPPNPTLERLGVGVDQQLVRVEPMAIGGIVGPVNAVAVKQARTGIRQISVPDLVGIFRKHDARLLMAAGAIEQAQLDLLGMRRKDREIDALTVPSGPKRVRATRPHLPWRRH
jgi:hypothetical protein